MPALLTEASPSALLAGATGLVGRELLVLLQKSSAYGALHVLLRRVMPELPVDPKLRLHVVSFDALPEPLPPAGDVYVALGTTIKAAGSKQAFRRVDFEYVVELARAARRAGAERLAVVSALGADASSRVFYNRVKGEMEQAVAALGYRSVIIAQPSLLVGDRGALGQPSRLGEAIAQRVLAPLGALVPASVRPILAADVAASLVRATLQAAPGVQRLSSAQLHASAR